VSLAADEHWTRRVRVLWSALVDRFNRATVSRVGPRPRSCGAFRLSLTRDRCCVSSDELGASLRRNCHPSVTGATETRRYGRPRPLARCLVPWTTSSEGSRFHSLIVLRGFDTRDEAVAFPKPPPPASSPCSPTTSHAQTRPTWTSRPARPCRTWSPCASHRTGNRTPRRTVLVIVLIAIGLAAALINSGSNSGYWPQPFHDAQGPGTARLPTGGSRDRAGRATRAVREHGAPRDIGDAGNQSWFVADTPWTCVPNTQRLCCQARSISIESPASRITRARGGLVFAA